VSSTSRSNGFTSVAQPSHSDLRPLLSPSSFCPLLRLSSRELAGVKDSRLLQLVAHIKHGMLNENLRVGMRVQRVGADMACASYLRLNYGWKCSVGGKIPTVDSCVRNDIGKYPLHHMFGLVASKFPFVP
jgi:hypothetical protein